MLIDIIILQWVLLLFLLMLLLTLFLLFLLQLLRALQSSCVHSSEKPFVWKKKKKEKKKGRWRVLIYCGHLTVTCWVCCWPRKKKINGFRDTDHCTQHLSLISLTWDAFYLICGTVCYELFVHDSNNPISQCTTTIALLLILLPLKPMLLLLLILPFLLTLVLPTTSTTAALALLLQLYCCCQYTEMRIQTACLYMRSVSICVENKKKTLMHPISFLTFSLSPSVSVSLSLSLCVIFFNSLFHSSSSSSLAAPRLGDAA